jgi:hypothetical protein
MDFCEISGKRDGAFKKFGKIKFALGCPVSAELKKVVSQIEESDWKVLKTKKDKFTGEEKVIMEGAEVCYVTNTGSKSKKSPEYRFVATRSLMSDQQVLPEISEEESSFQEKLPFPIATINHLKYKVHAIVSNHSREDLNINQLVEWYHQRGGFSEQAHSIMKTDFAGGQLPSKYFGANAAWWWIMMLSLNTIQILKELALGPTRKKKRMKALRFSLFNIPGKVIYHGGELVIRMVRGHPSFQWLLTIRQRINALVAVPT